MLLKRATRIWIASGMPFLSPTEIHSGVISEDDTGCTCRNIHHAQKIKAWNFLRLDSHCTLHLNCLCQCAWLHLSFKAWDRWEMLDIFYETLTSWMPIFEFTALCAAAIMMDSRPTILPCNMIWACIQRSLLRKQLTVFISCRVY